jgi:hypothetical protein
MKSYTIREGFLTDDDRIFLQKLDTIFDNLLQQEFEHPKLHEMIPITCHHIAHALSQIFPGYKAVNGRYGIKGQEHSRLEEIISEEQMRTERNIQGHTIIDPYPVCGVRPHLIY